MCAAKYHSKQADRLKLARAMRAALVARRVSSPKQRCYGIQWIGQEFWIFAMHLLHGETYIWTEVFRGTLREDSWVTIIHAFLALRTLLTEQHKWEKEGTFTRQYRKDAMATPVKVGHHNKATAALGCMIITNFLLQSEEGKG